MFSVTKELNFGRTAAKNCRTLQGTTGPTEMVKPWPVCHICSDPVIYVTIGPAGGDKGYTAITSKFVITSDEFTCFSALN